MTHKPRTTLSRRDALKVLGAAAGGSVLANLPTKWKTPQLASGVLPAHAQTSVLHTLACDALLADVVENATSILSVVNIAPAESGIVMKYVITLTNMDFSPAHATEGTVATDGSGQAAVTFDVVVTGDPIADPHVVRVTWSFNNPSDGTGDCFEEWEPTIVV